MEGDSCPLNTEVLSRVMMATCSHNPALMRLLSSEPEAPRPLQQEQGHIHLSLSSGVGEAGAPLGGCSLKLTASGVTCAWETLL